MQRVETYQKNGDSLVKKLDKAWVIRSTNATKCYTPIMIVNRNCAKQYASLNH